MDLAYPAGPLRHLEQDFIGVVIDFFAYFGNSLLNADQTFVKVILEGSSQRDQILLIPEELRAKCNIAINIGIGKC